MKAFEDAVNDDASAEDIAAAEAKAQSRLLEVNALIDGLGAKKDSKWRV